MTEDTTTGSDDGPTDEAGATTGSQSAGPGGTAGGRRWREDAESALDDVGAALQAAWEGSREARISALEAAKGALNHLGTAIDQATRAARDTWGDDTPTATPGDQDPPTAASDEVPPPPAPPTA